VPIAAQETVTTETSLQPLRLTLDRDEIRVTARMRLVAAVVTGVAAIWLAWVERSIGFRLLGLTGGLFAARWLLVYRNAARTVSSADAHYLEITTERLTVASGAQQRAIPLEHVERIELDEDRLVVVLRLGSGEELPIEPVYGGLGLRDLAETLERYLSARPRLGCTELNP
jgi:hypothetical protein